MTDKQRGVKAMQRIPKALEHLLEKRDPTNRRRVERRSKVDKDLPVERRKAQRRGAPRRKKG